MGEIFRANSKSRQKHVPLVAGMIARHFPSDAKDFFRGEDIGDLSERESSLIDVKKLREGALKYVIHTKVGGGPRVIEGEEDRLLDAHGLPKHSTANA